MNVNARVASCRSDFVVGNIGGFLVDASNALYRAARETAVVVVDVIFIIGLIIIIAILIGTSLFES